MLKIEKLKGQYLYEYILSKVSTLKQDERRQEISLDNYKTDKKYVDKTTGKNADRLEF